MASGTVEREATAPAGIGKHMSGPRPPTVLGVGPVVVGVHERQSDTVVATAAILARRLGTGIVAVVVDPSQITLGVREDGTVITEPIDPDVADAGPATVPDALRERVLAVAAVNDVADVEVVARVDDPTGALIAVADERDAALLVVGAKTGRHRVAAFLGGSVAARLSHRQHRPVVVVPVDPVRPDEPLPWIAG
jgi:nucleotide-binding universal stress UspA family protein